jgi:hypothetical protein
MAGDTASGRRREDHPMAGFVGRDEAVHPQDVPSLDSVSREVAGISGRLFGQGASVGLYLLYQG